MINLIPDSEKKRLKKEYYIRLTTVALGLFFVVSTLGALLLVPSFIVLRVSSNELSAELAQLEASIETAGGGDTQEFVEETNRKSALIAAFKKREPTSLLLQSIIQAKTNEVHIRSITFTEKRNGKPATVSIRGTADSRTTLVAFTKELESDSRFGEVNLPLKDLASNRDIPFGLTIEVIN